MKQNGGMITNFISSKTISLLKKIHNEVEKSLPEICRKGKLSIRLSNYD